MKSSSPVLPVLSAKIQFPDVAKAIALRDGLVAIGGDLSVQRLLAAYRQGIFPWFGENEPICWWALSPRMVLFPSDFYVGRSLRKALKSQVYTVTVNRDFGQVICLCARQKRPGQNGTWIVPAMQDAYISLHKAGFAHSFEYWDESGTLQGGLYGVQIGQVFCGESMFARTDNASKIAFVHAVRYLSTLGLGLIDCQMHTEHLARFGARQIPYFDFLADLQRYQNCPLKNIIYPQILACNRMTPLGE